MPLTGDFAKLDKFRASIRDLTASGFRRELSEVLGLTAVKLVADEFRKECDPYAQPWAPIKARRRGNVRRARIGRDTGRMAASVNSQTTSAGFRINVPVVYSPYFNFGTSRQVARALLPDLSKGLGPVWLDAFNRDATALIRRRLQVAA